LEQLMHGRVSLGRIAGVEVSAQWSLAVMVVAIVLFLAAGAFPSLQPQLTPFIAVLAACGAAVLFVASVLAHELAQAIVARRGGARFRSLTLFGFGGIPYTGLDPAPPAVELRMAVAGPMLSLLLGMLCFAMASANASPGSAILVSVGWMNVALCAVNLLPGYPLAAGRAFCP
jgi:Zn-dependent protease